MNGMLEPSDFEDLVAWLDGELPEARARQVERFVRENPAWARAAREQRRLDELLTACEAPPVPDELSARIVARARGVAAHRTIRLRGMRVAVPLAAAAAVALAVMLWNDRPTPPPSDDGGQVHLAAGESLRGLDETDRFVVSNMEFFRNYEVCEVLAKSDGLVDVETLEAIGRVDKTRPGQGS
ncbi:MAG TPA: hypothetical protein DCX07_07750 [Phycisphaerales bacterium]|nr:hypothetical protein [Phycisphaerales bacterium]